jgi:hypothetical protein
MVKNVKTHEEWTKRQDNFDNKLSSNELNFKF